MKYLMKFYEICNEMKFLMKFSVQTSECDVEVA